MNVEGTLGPEHFAMRESAATRGAVFHPTPTQGFNQESFVAMSPIFFMVNEFLIGTFLNYAYTDI